MSERVKTFFTVERFDKPTEIIQRLAVVTSLVFAGIWAFYQFAVVHKDDISPKPNLSSDISVNEIVSREQNFLEVLVEVENTGNDPMWIEFSSPPLIVSSVEYVDGKPTFKDQKTYSFNAYHLAPPRSIKREEKISFSPGVYKVPEIVITPSSKFELPFLIPIQKNGVYHLNFHAIQRHENANEIVNLKKFSEFTVLSTHASKYFVVKRINGSDS